MALDPSQSEASGSSSVLTSTQLIDKAANSPNIQGSRASSVTALQNTDAAIKSQGKTLLQIDQLTDEYIEANKATIEARKNVVVAEQEAKTASLEDMAKQQEVHRPLYEATLARYEKLRAASAPLEARTLELSQMLNGKDANGKPLNGFKRFVNSIFRDTIVQQHSQAVADQLGIEQVLENNLGQAAALLTLENSASQLLDKSEIESAKKLTAAQGELAKLSVGKEVGGENIKMLSSLFGLKEQQTISFLAKEKDNLQLYANDINSLIAAVNKEQVNIGKAMYQDWSEYKQAMLTAAEPDIAAGRTTKAGVLAIAKGVWDNQQYTLNMLGSEGLTMSGRWHYNMQISKRTAGLDAASVYKVALDSPTDPGASDIRKEFEIFFQDVQPDLQQITAEQLGFKTWEEVEKARGTTLTTEDIQKAYGTSKDIYLRKNSDDLPKILSNSAHQAKFNMSREGINEVAARLGASQEAVELVHKAIPDSLKLGTESQDAAGKGAQELVDQLLLLSKDSKDRQAVLQDAYKIAAANYRQQTDVFAESYKTVLGNKKSEVKFVTKFKLGGTVKEIDLTTPLGWQQLQILQASKRAMLPKFESL